MPDGQIAFRTNFPALHVKAQSWPRQKAVPLSVLACQMTHEGLHAQNILLRSALEQQRAKAADLQCILCSVDMATLCVCPALRLRLFNAAAGHLLGIGHDDVGLTLSLCGPLPLAGPLTERIRAVLGSGIAEKQIVTMTTGQRLLCRLLPLRAGSTAAAVDGVILTFGDVPVASSENGRDACGSQDDHKRAGGYPDLASGLTRRQHQVLGRVLAGQPSKNIAVDLGISRRTVENHRAAIMARTGATSLPALARLAVGADVGGDCKTAPLRRVCD